jgi:heat shock protein HtpX
MTALMVVVALNHWLVVSALLAFFAFGMTGKFDPDHEVPGIAFLLLGAVLGASGVAIYTAVKVRNAARATVKEIGAVLIQEGEHQQLHNLMAELAIATGMHPVPIAVLDDEVPNALTVGAGRSSTVIVVTRGLLDALTRDEIEAVLAAQLCAVQRLDVALQTIVTACTTSTIAIHEWYRKDWKDPRVWVLIAGTWPSMVVAAQLRRRALARCDLGADDLAVSITRHPEALVRALVKLLDDGGVVAAVTPRNAALWFEPVPSDEEREGALERYAMTPPLEVRIDRLMSLSAGASR